MVVYVYMWCMLVCVCVCVFVCACMHTYVDVWCVYVEAGMYACECIWKGKYDYHDCVRKKMVVALERGGGGMKEWEEGGGAYKHEWTTAALFFRPAKY